MDSAIKLPTGIKSLEEFCDSLKEDITFTLYKNKNKRKLHFLKYTPEKYGGDNLKFISDFCQFCNNAEINKIADLFHTMIVISTF